MYRQEDGLTGGIGGAQDGTQGGVTFYVHTDDPKGTLAKAEAAGGRVLMPLTEVAPETTIALFADPEGHVIGLDVVPMTHEGRVRDCGPGLRRSARALITLGRDQPTSAGTFIGAPVSTYVFRPETM